MAETFITLEEAAGLEGASYEAIKKKIQRNPDAFKTKYEQTPSGGKPRVLISLSSLSKRRVEPARKGKASRERTL